MKTITTQLLQDATKRGGDGRRMTPPERQAELLAEYEASGLSMAGFARREGLKYPTFASWVKKCAAQSAARPERSTIAPRFAEVRWPAMPASGAELSVTLPDGLILRGAAPVALAALVRALLVDRS